MPTNILSNAVSDTPAGFDIPVELHVLDEPHTILNGRIRRASPSRFELSCDESMKEGQRLALSHEGRRIEVAVSAVEQNALGRYSLTVAVVNDGLGEVRSELRLPTDLHAVVRVAGTSEPINARVVDMSPSGMGIEMHVQLMLGVKVCVNIEQGLAFGEIRFCRQLASGVYLAGFLLEEYICQDGSP